MSTESIASSSSTQPKAGATCPNCGAPMADDQRYCLECGERRMPVSSLLFGGAQTELAAQAGDAQTAPATRGAGAAPPPSPPSASPRSEPPASQRNQTLTVLAGVGVLLLAVGVGVLIGRAGAPKQTTSPPEVITVASGGSGAASTSSSTETTFTSSWPSGTSGYTVQLQTLPQSSAVSAVEAAKTSLTAKGATGVGALKSEEFSSLPSGNYVIYSGVYHTRAQAEKALPALRKKFPGAKVIKVANGGSSSSAGKESEPPTSSPGGVGASESKPAPPSVLNGLKGSHGKSYEEKSKNLPNVVETG